MDHQLTIVVHPGLYAVCRLEPTAAVPSWAAAGNFCSITRTSEELSIVCEDAIAPQDSHAERRRRLLQIEGKLAFSLTGVLASVALPLAEAEISIFAVSTYDTDYLLVSDDDLKETTEVLEAAGHIIREREGTSAE